MPPVIRKLQQQSATLASAAAAATVPAFGIRDQDVVCAAGDRRPRSASLSSRFAVRLPALFCGDRAPSAAVLMQPLTRSFAARRSKARDELLCGGVGWSSTGCGSLLLQFGLLLLLQFSLLWSAFACSARLALRIVLLLKKWQSEAIV